VLKVITRSARFTQHMHHVKTPAVHVPWRLKPVADNAVFTAVDFVDQRRRLEIQLRQAWVAQPVQRVALFIKAVPVTLRRIRVMACPAHRLVMTVKPRVRIPAVVEHAVQNQAYPFVFSVLSQAQQRGIAAKLLINMTIIFGVVFMHARGFKHRVKVQRRHAQFFQVREFFADPVEIAAVKRRATRLRGQRFIPCFEDNVVTCCVVVIHLVLVCSALFAAGKAVRENLVKHLIVNPLRAIVRVIDGKLLQPGRRKTAKPLRGKPQLAVIPQQFKTVATTRLSTG
jgi:hypothetical protein